MKQPFRINDWVKLLLADVFQLLVYALKTVGVDFYYASVISYESVYFFLNVGYLCVYQCRYTTLSERLNFVFVECAHCVFIFLLSFECSVSIFFFAEYMILYLIGISAEF